MKVIMKIVKSYEKSGLFIKGLISERFLKLGASLLGNLLTGKGATRVSEGKIRTKQYF